MVFNPINENIKFDEKGPKYIIETYSKAEMNYFLKADDYKYVIDEIWQKCFKPNNKHGYGDELLDDKKSYDIIEKLADLYREILNDNEI